MNQTGVRSTGSRRQARRKRSSIDGPAYGHARAVRSRAPNGGPGTSPHPYNVVCVGDALDGGRVGEGTRAADEPTVAEGAARLRSLSGALRLASDRRAPALGRRGRVPAVP